MSEDGVKKREGHIVNLSQPSVAGALLDVAVNTFLSNERSIVLSSSLRARSFYLC